jgi:leucyl aminopeptidase
MAQKEEKVFLNVHFKSDDTTTLCTILNHHDNHVTVSLGPKRLAPSDIVALMHFVLKGTLSQKPLRIDLLKSHQYINVQSKAFYYYTKKNENENEKEYKKHNKEQHHMLLLLQNNNVVQTNKMLQENEMIMGIMNEIRRVCDLPPDVMYPHTLMRYMVDFAQKHRVQVLAQWDEAQLRAKGLMGVVSVGKGSTRAHRSCMAILALNYQSNLLKQKQKPIVLIGKGVTYDSGGYSLKPPAHMKNMKHDKTGALIILGVMGVLAHLGIQCPVVAILPLAENVLSAGSLKPDEIIRSHKGLTVEVGNTDAEGRLMLMDALSLATLSYQPRAIIDVATLTRVNFFCGKYGAIYGNHAPFQQLLQDIGARHGDAFWAMPPLDAFVGDTRNTPVANVKNDMYACSSHSVTAAAFLSNFVPGNIPWAHLDLGESANLYEKHADLNEAKTNAFLTLVYFFKALSHSAAL